MLWVTWSLAQNDEQKVLNIVADRILVRATRSALQADAAMATLSVSQDTACSAAHIGRMQREVFNTLSIEEMGYFESGFLKCTSWGNVTRTIPATMPNFRTQSGLDVTFSLQPALLGGTHKLAFTRGSYNVLVDPARFVDVITGRKIDMGLATKDGRVFALTEGSDHDLLQRIALRTSIDRDERYAFSTASSADWLAVAAERRPALFATLRREQLFMLPLALVLAAVMVSTVIWFSKRRLSLRGELEIAIRRNEFTVHYQPLLDLSSRLCIGAEALVRWQRPDRSWVRPDLFIPVAEQSGLIQKITGLVIAEISKDLGPFLAKDPSLHIAINLSAEDLASGTFFEPIETLVREHRIQPDQIWLEVTERGLLDYAVVIETISTARQAGYIVCIDDFGTGYSSLQHLQKMSFDILKIDKSFVDSIGVSSPKGLVINHIIEMAKSLKVSIVAEGVETADQASFLQNQDVEFGQGWLFSRALPRDDFVSYVSKFGTRQTNSC